MANRNKSTPSRSLVCRVCLSSDELQVAIYGAYARDKNIPTKLHVCLPIQLNPHDHLPKTICFRCVAKLDEYYDFYCHSLTSQRIANGEELAVQKYLRRRVDRKLTAAVERRNAREGRGQERAVPASIGPEPSASFLDMKQSQRKRKASQPAPRSKRFHSTYTVPSTVFD
uniref:Zinc finger protein hangover n=1 Tax=Culex pipiens TaxID=7175 RepID=A0A8D8JAL7_CULPI